MNPATREGRLVQTLQEVAARDIPAGLNLWPAIRARLGPAPRRATGARPAAGLAWAGLATVLLLTVGLAAALTPTLNRLASALVHPPNLYPLLGPSTVLTQTIGGYTVALEPLYDRDDGQPYANAIYISLLATVTDQYGKALTYDDVWLSDAQGGDAPELSAVDGPAFPWLGLGSWLSDRDSGAGTPAVRYKLRLFFDATGLRQVPADLPLHLSLQLHPHVLPADAQGPPGSVQPPEPVIGRFTFDFRLPFDPLVRTAEVQQTVWQNGVPLTLERVVATRRSTLAVLRFPSPNGSPVTDWVPVTDLVVGQPGHPTTLADMSNPFVRYGGWQPNGSWVGLADTYLVSSGGPWTLTVRYLMDGTQAAWTPVNGPWTFHFTPPPAAGQTSAAAPTPTPRPEVPSQTLNGYTVALYPISASAGRVVLGYTVIGPAGEESTVCVQNPRLLFNRTAGVPGWVGLPCQSLPSPANATAPADATLTFDTQTPIDGHTRFKLDLSLSVYPTQDTVPDAESLLSRAIGPFHFEFSMPVDSSRRVIEVGRIIDTHGVAITLERVIMTPRETRLYLSYRAPNGAPLPAQWYPILSLQAGDWSSDREGKDVETDRQQPDPQHLVYTIHTSLMDRDGEWALVIQELQRGNAEQRLIGPWEFHFTVPGTP